MKPLLVITVVVAWLVIPTGTPDDVITIMLIKWFGEAYLLILLIILLLLWYQELTPQKVGREMRKITNNIKRKLR